MSTVVELLSEKANRILKRGNDISDFSKEDFLNFMGVTQSSLKAVVESFEEIQSAEMKSLGVYVQERINDRAAMNIQIYRQFLGRIGNEAQKDERNGVFSSILNAIKKYQLVLNEIEKNINSLFENKVISLYNTKLSHVAIIGVIKNAGTLCDFAWFLFNGVCFDIGLGIERPARYRFSFLNTYKDQMGACVNDLYAGVGDGAIFNEIVQLRRNNKDILLVNEEEKVNDSMISTAGLNQSLSSSIIAGLMDLNIFRWIGEAWNLYRDSHYRGLEEKKDWMKTHVQLLRFKLQGMSEDDREYQKYQKIINNYDNMVAAADEKIKQYRKED